MKFADYLLMSSPDSMSGESKNVDPTSQISLRRIILSLAGLLLGIFFSFLITGIEKTTVPGNNQGTASGTMTEQFQTSTSPHLKPQLVLPGLKDLFPLIIISLVICGLSYQGLYASLKLYNNEPAFLVLFVAFQYGFFWESVVRGVSVLF